MEHSVQADKQQRRKQPAPQAADPEIQAVQPQSGIGSLVACARVDPGRLSPSDVLRLQRVVGNRAVTALIQAKLAVGPVGDRYEQEADRVAEQVLTMPSVSPGRREAGGEVQRQEEEEELQARPLATTITPLVQRQEEEEELQAKPLAATITPLVQRQEEEEELQTKPLLQRQEEEEEEVQTKPLLQRQEEEEELQAKPLLQRQEEEEELQTKPLAQRQTEDELQMESDTPRVGREGGPVAPSMEAAIQGARGGGQLLDSAIQTQMGETMGHDFSGVRVHTDAEADALNQQLSAQAFTTGQDIFFRQGAYSPSTGNGRELLAHELSHVVQQSSGQVSEGGSRMTVRPAGDAFEQEADALVQQKAAGESGASWNILARAGQTFGAIQRGLWSGLGRKHGLYAWWWGVRVDNTTVPGCTIWSLQGHSIAQANIRRLVISSHGGDTIDEPVWVTPGLRIHFYTEPGQMTYAQLSSVDGAENGKLDDPTNPNRIRNYILTKYQYSGGGRETYGKICRFLRRKGQEWGVLTVNRNSRVNYQALIDNGAFNGVTDVYALHCRGGGEPTRRTRRGIPIPGMVPGH